MTGLATTPIAAALFAAGLLVATDGARAQSLAEAEAAFHDGRFLEAADLGEAIGTSDALAMATAALAIHGYYLADDGDKQPLFKRGMALAEKAVALDGGNAWAPSSTEMSWRAAVRVNLGPMSLVLVLATTVSRPAGAVFNEGPVCP